MLLGGAGLVAIVGLIVWHPTLAASRADWPSARAKILATRISVVGAHESNRGGFATYRVEARVVYTSGGISRDAWVRASDVMSDRSWLEFWLSQRTSKTCTVRWNPHNPNDVEAVLERNQPQVDR